MLRLKCICRTAIGAPRSPRCRASLGARARRRRKTCADLRGALEDPRRGPRGTMLAVPAIMTRDYPVQIDPISPAHFDRLQLVLRVVIAVVLGWVGLRGGWLVCFAIAISSVGSERYLRDIAPPLWRVLAWLLRLQAYMSLVVDRFPTGDAAGVEIQLRCTGQP